MPMLIYTDSEGRSQEQEIFDKGDILRIGSDPALNDIVLPTTLDVASRHAVIMRSAINKLLVLVNLAGSDTRINGRPVVSLQVLHQKDTLQLGQAQLMMWEVRITAASAENRSAGQVCQVCSMKIKEDDQVIICPRCSSATHRNCWFELDQCPKYACGYPIRDTVIEALSPGVTFERSLDASSELIRYRKRCQASTAIDQFEFQERDYVAYCPSPSCHAPFHLQCWLGLESCTMPGCGYEIQKLIERVFGGTGDAQSGVSDVK